MWRYPERCTLAVLLSIALLLVPEPVWNTSTGKWPSHDPSITSSAARRIPSVTSSGT